MFKSQPPALADVENVLRRFTLPHDDGSVLDSGAISGLNVDDKGNIKFVLSGTQAQLRHLHALRDDMQKELAKLKGTRDVQVILTNRQSSQPQKHQIGQKIELAGVKKIIAVGSGKGGVGKSSTAWALALAMQTMGLNIGLLDADIYGPSLPTLMGISGPVALDENKKIIPAVAQGMKAMSIGLLIPPDKAMIWRGPMVMGAVQQMLRDVAWGELDVLIIDLPPGTGDVQLTLAQQANLSGAVIVSTPQDLALIDARKALKMFEQMHVPVLGMIENMSYFVCPHCGGESHIFSCGGAKKAAEELGCEFLGDIPLLPVIRESADAGNAQNMIDSRAGEYYAPLAKKIIKTLGLLALVKG